MPIKPVLMIGNPELRKTSSDITDLESNEFGEIIQNLKDTLTHLQRTKKIGRALAAPQIGYPKKIIFIQTPQKSFFMVNPEITKKSDEMTELWDSCYSFDLAFFVRIKRHKEISVRYQNEHGEKLEEIFSNGFSDLIQHEIDHLSGILATDYLVNPKNIILREEWEKLN